MTTIRNKQTGETLTGEVLRKEPYLRTFKFRISGTSDDNEFIPGDWEILPPPLPTGIGASVQDSRGFVFVRISDNVWRTLADTLYTPEQLTACGSYTILSEGVRLD